MPISLAQPAPAGAFNDIVNQGNLPAYLSAYTSMQNALQSRYASDLHTNNQTGLGYAQLNSDASLRQQALGLQAAELAQRPAMQEAAIQMHAQAAMDQWLGQQQFTARDQMELNRQQNAIGELMTKRDNGDISEQEFYQMAGQAAPRINALKAREQYTSQKALEDQRKAHAQLFQEQATQRDNLLSFQRAEMDGKLGYWVPPKYKMQLAEMMKDAHPDVAQGTDEWDAMSTMLADEMGWAERYTKNKAGEMVFEKQVKGASSAAASPASAGQEAQTSHGRYGSPEAVDKMHSDMFDSAYKLAASQMDKKDKDGNPIPVDPQEIKNRAEQILRDKLTYLQQRRDEKHPSGASPAISKADENIQAIAALRDNKTVPPNMAGYAINKLKTIKSLLEKYPPGKRPKAIEKRIANLQDQYDQFNNTFLVQRDSGARGVTPQTVPAEAVQTEPEQSIARTGLNWLRDSVGGIAPITGGGN